MVFGPFLRALKKPVRVKVFVPVHNGETFELSIDSNKVPMEYNKYEVKQFEITPDGELNVWI